MADATRGRMGRIQQLPPEIKAYLDRRLREGAAQAAVIDETRTMLAELGEPPLSRSGVNRYATRMEKIGRRIREAREVSEAWIAKFGEEPAGDVGAMIVEMLRTLAFEAAHSAAESDGPVDTDMINDMALAVRRLEQAAETGAKREREIRTEAAEAAGTEARRLGISPDFEAAIRRVAQGGA